MVDWSKTKLIEFMSHSKCQQDEACEALAGFDYPVNSSRKSELWKLWLQNNLLSQLSWQSTEEFIDLAIKNGYPPPWLDFAIERGLYIAKQETAGIVKTHAINNATHPLSLPAQKKTALLRRDVLTAPIEKAIKAAGNYETADVYLQLKEYALNEQPPFLGCERNGDLTYTDSKNEKRFFKKSSLSQRLIRLKKILEI
jgi:hypothetical protein